MYHSHHPLISGHNSEFQYAIDKRSFKAPYSCSDQALTCKPRFKIVSKLYPVAIQIP